MKTISALQTFVVILLSTAHLPGQTPGALDTTFHAQMPTNFVYQFFGPLAIQPDGKILVGGHSSTADSGSRFLARIGSDGVLDSCFRPEGIRGCGEWMFSPEDGRGGCTGGAFSGIVGQADGKILLSGYEWGTPELHQVGLARLNADGSVDPTFVTNPRFWDVRKLVRLSNGSILVPLCCDGEEFSLVRLKPNGAIDFTLSPHIQVANGSVYSFAVQPDRRTVLSIPDTLIEGKKRNVIRLLADGSYDSSFPPVLTDGDVQVVESLPDGKILLGSGGGGFRSVNGGARSGLARLHADGRLDLDFIPFTGDLDTSYSAQTVVIEATENLLLPTWRPISTNSVTATAALKFTDPDGLKFPQRFYRAVSR